MCSLEQRQVAAVRRLLRRRTFRDAYLCCRTGSWSPSGSSACFCFCADSRRHSDDVQGFKSSTLRLKCNMVPPRCLCSPRDIFDRRVECTSADVEVSMLRCYSGGSALSAHGRPPADCYRRLRCLTSGTLRRHLLVFGCTDDEQVFQLMKHDHRLGLGRYGRSATHFAALPMMGLRYVCVATCRISEPSIPADCAIFPSVVRVTESRLYEYWTLPGRAQVVQCAAR